MSITGPVHNRLNAKERESTTISASARVFDTSKDNSRYVPALDDLSLFAYQSQRSAAILISLVVHSTLLKVKTISASARVPDTSKDNSRYVPALDDLSLFAYQSQRSARDPHLIGGPFNPT
ncbi:hypothetical protein DY000_02037223 [Brassica cretica]|uniref:Uncharacterized protein n=1 Tax=Brassica cretica TaxID=69181 RepID=A0ABQ7BQE7_BRACR|nr:hypothetical protein DY000_02037223 [Brassica cretica]